MSFNVLPYEMLYEIILNLPFKEAQQVSLTNRFFHDVVNHEKLPLEQLINECKVDKKTVKEKIKKWGKSLELIYSLKYQGFDNFLENLHISETVKLEHINRRLEDFCRAVFRKENKEELDKINKKWVKPQDFGQYTKDEGEVWLAFSTRSYFKKLSNDFQAVIINTLKDKEGDFAWMMVSDYFSVSKKEVVCEFFNFFDPGGKDEIVSYIIEKSCENFNMCANPMFSYKQDITVGHLQTFFNLLSEEQLPIELAKFQMHNGFDAILSKTLPCIFVSFFESFSKKFEFSKKTLLIACKLCSQKDVKDPESLKKILRLFKSEDWNDAMLALRENTELNEMIGDIDGKVSHSAKISK